MSQHLEDIVIGITLGLLAYACLCLLWVIG